MKKGEKAATLRRGRQVQPTECAVASVTVRLQGPVQENDAGTDAFGNNFVSCRGDRQEGAMLEAEKAPSSFENGPGATGRKWEWGLWGQGRENASHRDGELGERSTLRKE